MLLLNTPQHRLPAALAAVTVRSVLEHVRILHQAGYVHCNVVPEAIFFNGWYQLEDDLRQAPAIAVGKVNLDARAFDVYQSSPPLYIPLEEHLNMDEEEWSDWGSWMLCSYSSGEPLSV